MRETWNKLDKLQGWCETEIASLMDGEHVYWCITLKRRSDVSGIPIVVVSDNVEIAVSQAVDQAQGRGWLADRSTS